MSPSPKAFKRCVQCTERIPVGAVKCLKCQAWQPNACVACRSPLSDEKPDLCPACGASQKIRTCPNCSALMPGDALYCKNCNAFRDWRRLIPRNSVVLALIASILSLLTVIVSPIVKWWSHESKTHARLVGVDLSTIPNHTTTTVLLAAIVNTGTRSSVVRSATLDYGVGDTVVHVQLNVLNPSEKVVKPGETVVLQMTAGPDTKEKPREAPPATATLNIEIEETSRFGNPDPEKRSDTVDSAFIEAWRTVSALP